MAVLNCTTFEILKSRSLKMLLVFAQLGPGGSVLIQSAGGFVFSFLHMRIKSFEIDNILRKSHISNLGSISLIFREEHCILHSRIISDTMSYICYHQNYAITNCRLSTLAE